MMLNKLNCPCGLEKTYTNCCLVFHKDIEKVNTAEQLMRSRYSAFTKAMGNYLLNSHHSSTRQLSEKKEIVKWAKSVKWDRLEIISKSNGLSTDNMGTVEFKAYFYEGEKLNFIHENSQFKKENGIWMYLGFVE